MLAFYAFASYTLILLSAPSQLRGAYGQYFPDADQLSEQCSTLLCDALKLVSTCPVFGMELTPTCADYLMGFIFACPGYPSEDDIFEAPPICMPEYLAIAGRINNGLSLIDVESVMNGNYSDYCYQRCFQDYINATYTYTKTGCPLGNFTLLSIPLNAFRGISCGSTTGTRETEKNCYDVGRAFIPAPSPTPSPPTPYSDFTCDALASPEGSSDYDRVCAALTSNECCLGNQAAMLSQSFQAPFPPCLMKQCYVNSKAINEFCGNHINFAAGTITAWVNMQTLPPLLPNMYNETYVAQFQLNLITYFRGAIYPQEVTLYDFTYYDAMGAAINNNYASAYNLAVRGNFSFTFILINVTETELQKYAEGISSPQYTGFLSSKYGATVQAAVKASTFFAADPIEVSTTL